MSASPSSTRSGGGLNNLVEGLAPARLSTADHVANVLRGAIVKGQLAPGTALREVPLATLLGVSRNTVREALRQLEYQGVVRRFRHKGFVVTQVTVEDIEDIFRVRRVMEFAAIAASRDASPDRITELGEYLEGLRAAAARADLDAVVEADLGFHARLVGLLGSERFDAFFKNLGTELRLCLSIVDRSAQDVTSLVAEHEELHRLLAHGQAEQCCTLLAKHLDDAEATVLSAISIASTQAASVEISVDLPSALTDEPNPQQSVAHGAGAPSRGRRRSSVS